MTGIKIEGTPERPKLKLRERDRGFLEKYIQYPDRLPNQKQLNS